MNCELITDFKAIELNEFTPEVYMPDTLLDLDAIRGAIHTIFAGEFASEAEERGHRLPGRVEFSNLEQWAPRQPDAFLLPVAWHLLGRVEQAWGYSVGLVFHHGGIKSASDQEHALSALFLGIQGHGVNLADDFEDELERAAGVLLGLQGETWKFDPAPFYDEMNAVRDLARAVWNSTVGGTDLSTEGGE